MEVTKGLAYIAHGHFKSHDGRNSIVLGIYFGTTAVQIAGTYGSLVLAAWKDGGQLAESLYRIEARMPISEKMLKKIRIASITSVATATILVRTIQDVFAVFVKYFLRY